MVEVNLKKITIILAVSYYLIGVLMCIFCDGTISILSFTKGYVLYFIFFIVVPYFTFWPFYFISTWTKNRSRIARARISYEDYLASSGALWTICTLGFGFCFPASLLTLIDTGRFLCWSM